MTRKASAVWQGSIQQGKGTISTESGILKQAPYSFQTRFEGAPGTNPEELIGAAHAGCYSMAFSLFLGQAGFIPESIETSAEVNLVKQGEGFAITKIALKTKAKIPNLDDAKFQELAESAKANCPVSKLFKAEITLEAELLN